MEDKTNSSNKISEEIVSKEEANNGSNKQPTNSNNLLFECILWPIRYIQKFFLECERRDIVVMTVFIIIFVQSNMITSVGLLS